MSGALFTGAERFDAAAAYARLLREDGVLLGEATDRLDAWNRQFCVPPLDPDAVTEAVNLVYFGSDSTDSAGHHSVPQIAFHVREPHASTHRIAAISIRVKPALKAATLRAATGEGRSLASYVERLLVAHLKSIGFLGDAE
jgi:hypothetical protein